jgi:rod shape-determining protein MreD
VRLNLVEPFKVAVLMFVAAILQVTIFSQLDILGGYPDVVLLTLVAVALLRGSIYGAAAGFFAGLIVDTANLATLGVTSLLLTIAGYWIGRYGETTGRDRGHAPYVSVAVATVLVQFGALILHYLLGDTVSAKTVLLETLPPKVALNLLLTLPVYALTRRLLAVARPVETPAPVVAARAPTASCHRTRESKARIASRRSSR